VANRLVDVRPMLTHFYPVDEAVRAFEVADKRLENSIRVIIDLEGES
jgi:threonine dehydrogenase-like Zn-dependent dehydrogenase